MQDEDLGRDWDAEADRQRKEEPPPALSQAAFLEWRSPRVVAEHPTRLDNPLWCWLVRTRWSAYRANEMFGGPSPFDAGPMWCFDRFGMSETRLPDGRVVHIGGEHEDSYDPEFFIYNDVTTIDHGGAVAIYGYPPSSFPPTDFHTATLVDRAILIIGNLGYPEHRVAGSTPVYRLSIDTLRIERFDTIGEPPGWIHEHSAVLTDDAGAIVVRGGMVWRGDTVSMMENIDAWSLDLATHRWTRLTALDWQQWTMLRVDRRRNRLWDTRQELWRRDHGWSGMKSYWTFEDPPDFEALAGLYRLDEDSPPARAGEEYNVFRTIVDGVGVRFTEGPFHVQAMVEGRLSEGRLKALQRTVLATLERLDAGPWEIESLETQAGG